MQAKGSLSETSVRSLLEAAESERATGTLTLTGSEAKSSTLYVLFGRLVHAQGNSGTGDDVVVDALGWGEGEFEFDSRAKLPAEETVHTSVGDLMALAAEVEAQRQKARADSQGAPEPGWNPRPADWSQAPGGWNEPDAEDGLSSANASEAEHVAEETLMENQPPRGVKHRPSPRHGREVIPVPAGQVLYDSLKTSFVDFPRLLTTLEREAYTGYVRLLTDNASGLIFFREGVALECVFDAGAEPNVLLGREALREFNGEVSRGQGVLDVVNLSPELVDGLHHLTVARPVYTELYAGWVNLGELLKFLEGRELSGSVTVRSPQATGVIILDRGRLAGAYTSSSREVSETPDLVFELCQDPTSMIEVKAEVETSREPLDVEEVVGPRRSPVLAAPAKAAPAPTFEPPPAPAPTFEPAPAPAPALEPAPEAVAAETQAEAAAPTLEPEPIAVEPERFVEVPTVVPAPAPVAEEAGWTPIAAVPEFAAPAEVAPPAERPEGAEDWESLIAELQRMTEDALGNRARKVKDVIANATRSQQGIESAIDQVPTISILFVDSSRLEALAADMRNRLRSHLQ